MFVTTGAFSPFPRCYCCSCQNWVGWGRSLVLHILFIFWATLIWIVRQIQYWHRRTYIAIATTGIYMDTFPEWNSRFFVQRLVYKYGDYKRCYVEISKPGACGNREYHIMMKNQADVPILFARGLLGSRIFADKVNAMIEQVATAERDTELTTLLNV
jgi:hypothetical protein